MLHINLKTICCAWFALILSLSGQEKAPRSEDLLQIQMAERIRRNKNINSGVARPMSDEMNSVKRSQIENLSAEDFAKMSMDDPLLKWAYAELFLISFDAFGELDSSRKSALEDMLRRGEAVSPMLLKLMSENQETRIESSILVNIEYLETVRIEPFLDYARKLLKERTQTTINAHKASFILARHGTKEDVALFEWFIKERPYFTYSINKDLKTLKARLNPQTEPSPKQVDIPSSDAALDKTPPKVATNHPQVKDTEAFPTKTWIIGGLILVVLLVLYRFLRKGRRGDLLIRQ